jgi:nucleotide-binding universal stress UspA family protein
MANYFNNILAIVEWREDGDGCFLTAIQIANRFGGSLHMICLCETEETEASRDKAACDNMKTMELQRTYRPILEGNLSLHIHLMKGFSRNISLGYIARNRIDLVLVWKRSGWCFPAVGSWIYANWLSRKAVCPVLSLQGHMNLQSIRNILLPMERCLPVGKLVSALRLAGAYKARIHLVSVVDKGDNAAEDSSFLRACQLLQYHRSIDVDCKLLEGVSLPRSIAKYANKVNADLVIVCASKRTLVNGLFGLLFSRRHSAVSRISFMTLPADQLNIR